MFFTPKPQDQTQRLETLGRFAGGIAHDFNNILSIIDAAARLAAKESGGASDHIGKIIRATERGAALTRQMLAFGRQHVSVGETSDLCFEITQHEELITTILGDKIALTLEYPPTVLSIAVSSTEISQIILNLALNARAAMNGEGRFLLAVSHVAARDVPNGLMRSIPSEGALRLRFIDSGCGIAAADLPHIFDPFFTTRRQQGGSGLGLSVVYGIVAHHAGGIHVESKPGKGTRFDIYFPAAVEEVLSPTMPVKTHTSLAGKTVLLAEDEDDLRSVLVLMLTDMKMKVLEAENGNEAISLEAGYDGEIDFLLTDVIMPGVDGLTLGELFKRKQPKTNVVYMSGYPFIGDTDAPRQMPTGADFISKPLHSEKIREILERALARRDARMKEIGENDYLPD